MLVVEATSTFQLEPVAHVHLLRHEEVIQTVLDGLAHLDFHVVMEEGFHYAEVVGLLEHGGEFVHGRYGCIHLGDRAALADVSTQRWSAFGKRTGIQRREC